MRSPVAHLVQHAEQENGPYENWAYEMGRDFPHPGLKRDDNTHFSCVFDLPQAVTLPASLSKIQAAEGTFLFPVLWSTVGFQASFLPAVFRSTSLETQDRAFSVFKDSSKAFSTFGHWKEHLVHDESIEGAEVRCNTGYPVRINTVNEDWSDADAEDLPQDPGEPIVIVAIIDDGIPFAHRNFAKENGHETRINYCWSQSALDRGNPMLFGQEFTNEQIDDLYRDHDGDEGEIYRSAGLAGTPASDQPRPHDRRLKLPLDGMWSHGAHVLDSLAGHPPGHPHGEEARVHIIAVDLPAMAACETSGFGKDTFLLAAMHYIFDRADRIARQYAAADQPVPLVINLSYGHSSGPHDGTGILEAAFDELITARRDAGHPTQLVMPSGNMFLHSTHGVVTKDMLDRNNDTFEIQWIVPPEDRTSSFMEIWYPQGISPDGFEIALLPPENASLDQEEYVFGTGQDMQHIALISQGQAVGQISTENYRRKRWRHVIALAPTDAPEEKIPAPAGRWRLRVTRKHNDDLPSFTTDETGQIQAGGIQFWIQRDEDFGASGSGARQSYFLDPKNQLYFRNGKPMVTDRVKAGAFVRRFGTLSGMATGSKTLKVGGFVEQNGHAAHYSCAGALRYDNSRPRRVITVGGQLLVSAPSERSFAHPGIVGAGTRTGTYIAQSGTSSAAPQVARALARKFLVDVQNPAPTTAAGLTNQDIVAGLEQVQDGPTAAPASKNRLGSRLARRARGSGARDDIERLKILKTSAIYQKALDHQDR